MLLLGKSPSINVRKVLWLCEEIKLAIEHEEYGSGFMPTNTRDFIAMNPNAMVPVIKDGDFVLWESNAICRYIATKHGRTDLLPTELRARALVDQWMDWQATELNNSWRYAFMGLVRKSSAHQDADAIAASVANWNRHMQIFAAQIAQTQSYATGRVFTLADIVLGLSVHRWIAAPIEHADLPSIHDYYERLSERPAFLKHGRNQHP
jgi:glutathione S-transferase